MCLKSAGLVRNSRKKTSKDTGNRDKWKPLSKQGDRLAGARKAQWPTAHISEGISSIVSPVWQSLSHVQVSRFLEKAVKSNGELCTLLLCNLSLAKFPAQGNATAEQQRAKGRIQISCTPWPCIWANFKHLQETCMEYMR